VRTPSVGWAFVARLVVALLLCASAPAAFAQTFPPSFSQTGAPSGTVISQASFTMTATVWSGASFTFDIFSNAANSPHHVDLSGTGCSIPTPTRARVRPVLCGP
jgi:hypothetical protein